MQLAFYSQNRSHQWPGEDQTYNLDDSEVHGFPLTCQGRETICYGAWVTGVEDRYWGVGPNNQHKCKNCCFRCGSGQTPVLELN